MKSKSDVPTCFRLPSNIKCEYDKQEKRVKISWDDKNPHITVTYFIFWNYIEGLGLQPDPRVLTHAATIQIQRSFKTGESRKREWLSPRALTIGNWRFQITPFYLDFYNIENHIQPRKYKKEFDILIGKDGELIKKNIQSSQDTDYPTPPAGYWTIVDNRHSSRWWIVPYEETEHGEIIKGIYINIDDPNGVQKSRSLELSDIIKIEGLCGLILPNGWDIHRCISIYHEWMAEREVYGSTVSLKDKYSALWPELYAQSQTTCLSKRAARLKQIIDDNPGMYGASELAQFLATEGLIDGNCDVSTIRHIIKKELAGYSGAESKKYFPPKPL